MQTFENLIKSFSYTFPRSLIAQHPTIPRDHARLLIYDKYTNKINHDTFSNLVKYLPKNSVLVFNQTKVLPAKFTATKISGGKIQFLYIKHDKNFIWVLANRKLTIGSALTINKQLRLITISQNNQIYKLKPNPNSATFFKYLEKYGQTPLPPYIKHAPMTGKKLLAEYNTVFAKTAGSIASPTASLHFTKKLLYKITQAGVKIKFITLHVSLGTFATLSEQNIQQNKLHQEWYHIDKGTASFLNTAKQSGKTIVAIGTTTVRTLESATNKSGRLVKLSGTTDLFITEHSKLNFTDAIITNFHVPKSSLLMLVSAFVNKHQLLKLYKLAIQKKYRLFSFGDGMLIHGNNPSNP